MKIKKLELDNFMIFNHLDVEFSPDINIISGENSTGKTALIKILYSCMKGYSNACWSKNDVTKDRIEDMLVNKIQGVFRLDKDAIGRLVNRKQGSNRADIKINFALLYPAWVRSLLRRYLSGIRRRFLIPYRKISLPR